MTQPGNTIEDGHGAQGSMHERRIQCNAAVDAAIEFTKMVSSNLSPVSPPGERERFHAMVYPVDERGKVSRDYPVKVCHDGVTDLTITGTDFGIGLSSFYDIPPRVYDPKTKEVTNILSTNAWSHTEGALRRLMSGEIHIEPLNIDGDESDSERTDVTPLEPEVSTSRFLGRLTQRFSGKRTSDVQ